MNRFCLFLIACLLILAGALSLSAVTKVEASDIAIKMKSLSYDPNVVEVHVGDSVVWTNSSFTNHTATSDDDGRTFDTDEIKPEESSKPVKFKKEGEFKYHCKIHGKSMSGMVVVKQ